MPIDIRTVILSIAFVASSIVVALAEPNSEGRADATEKLSEARPIRVILPAPWEPATSSPNAPQK